MEVYVLTNEIAFEAEGLVVKLTARLRCGDRTTASAGPP